MRIFITGASGFIGRAVLRAISRRPHQLLLLAKDKRDYQALIEYRDNVVIGDLQNLNSFKKKVKAFRPKVCVHLAWEGIPDYSLAVSKRNLDNSLRLINFMLKETDCKKIIISGSCVEYGKTQGACKETDVININSYFPWAKYSLYRFADFMCKESKKDLIWFRLFYVYGPGQRKNSLISNLINALRCGVKPKINNPLNANDFIHVDDVAQAFKIAAEREIKQGVYNLGSGRARRVIDICKMVEKRICGENDLSNKIKLHSDPKETVNFWADTTKSAKNLGWQAQITLSHGIEQYISSQGGL